MKPTGLERGHGLSTNTLCDHKATSTLLITSRSGLRMKPGFPRHQSHGWWNRIRTQVRLALEPVSFTCRRKPVNKACFWEMRPLPGAPLSWS